VLGFGDAARNDLEVRELVGFDICDVREDDDGEDVEGFGDDDREYRGKNEVKLVVDFIGDFGDRGKKEKLVAVGELGDFGGTDEDFGDFKDDWKFEVDEECTD
jgi:hypothetical protein